MVTATALHVVLPPLALSSSQSGLAFPRDIPWWPSDLQIGMFSNKGNWCVTPLLSRSHVQQWQSEVQDRSLILDGLKEIQRLCGENGKLTVWLWIRKLLEFSNACLITNPSAWVCAFFHYLFQRKCGSSLQFSLNDKAVKLLMTRDCDWNDCLALTWLVWTCMNDDFLPANHVIILRTAFPELYKTFILRIWLVCLFVMHAFQPLTNGLFLLNCIYLHLQDGICSSCD